MNAHGTPAAAGHERGRFSPDRRDWLRLLGGVLFAAGALVLAIRKDSEWSAWALLALFLIPCALLYALGFTGRRAWPALQGWQSAFFAFAVLLLPLALFQLVEALDGNTGAELNVAWIFGLSAAVAAVTALATGARWQMLIAGVFAGVAWLALWSKILDEISVDRLRTILAAFALLLLLAALLSGRRRSPFTSDLVTVAGIAALLVSVVSLSALAGDAVDLEGFLPDDARPEQIWNVALLVVSLLLIAYGSRSLTRGPAYVGGIGLLVFIVVVGQDVVTRFNADEAGGVAGWPLILLIGGAILAALGSLLPRSDGGPTTEPRDWGSRDRGEVAATAPPAAATGVVPQQPIAPQQSPPQQQGGGGLLDSWRTPPPPPGGGQPPQQ